MFIRVGFLSAVFFLFLCTSSNAQNVPSLVEDYVSSIEIIKPALLDVFKYIECFDIWDHSNDSKQVTLLPENIPSLISSLEQMDVRLKEAASKVAAYVDSPDESIKIAANTILKTYEDLVKNNEESINKLRAFQGKTESERTADVLAEMDYGIARDISSFTSSLYFASEWVLEAVHKAYPNNLQGFPSEKRNDLVKRLKTIYGAEEKDVQLLEGVHFANAVVFLYEALTTVPTQGN